ncbi:class II fructose-bisphosphate aldolase [Candidatus Saccharibacteria bacterium]|nr:class II fructose-bisphosphate aldolase [Candidatus Saccharibacteria bacterium]
MALTIDQIRDNTARARQLMQRSRDEHFAIGAFNMDNQDVLIAIARAARKTNSPVMVEVTHDEVSAMGVQNVRDLVDNCKREYGVEMYINLDHGRDVEVAKQAIDAGFEFIHIDISQANHDASMDEIIEKTKEVVDYAKVTGALVEGEPHYFGGSSNLHTEAINYEEIKKFFTNPEEAKSFIKETGVDTYAVAIGNLHGKYPVPKILDIELLKEIRSSVPQVSNLSLHGGSGTPAEYFKQAAANGISKVNINSDLRYTYRTNLEKVLADNPDQYAVVKIMEPVREALQAVVEEKIAALGCAGKAEMTAHFKGISN